MDQDVSPNAGSTTGPLPGKTALVGAEADFGQRNQPVEDRDGIVPQMGQPAVFSRVTSGLDSNRPIEYDGKTSG